MANQPKVAIFGFSYKKNTSDTRCTPAATIVARLAQKGFNVSIHDPKVTQAGFELEMIAQGYGSLLNPESEAARIELVGNDFVRACQNASAIAILTEWDAFKTYDYSALVGQMG